MKKQSWSFLPKLCAGFAVLAALVFLARTFPRPVVLHRSVGFRQEQTVSSPAVTEPVFPMDVNQATVEELCHLPGIGPVIARAIVEYRDVHGPFQTPQALLGVSGIGEKRLEQILPYIITGTQEETNEDSGCG